MINKHIQYLSKFGTERIRNYSKFLLNTYKFNYIQQKFIEDLPKYYKANDGKLLVFQKIMNYKNLWYTIYL